MTHKNVKFGDYCLVPWAIILCVLPGCIRWKKYCDGENYTHYVQNIYPYMKSNEEPVARLHYIKRLADPQYPEALVSGPGEENVHWYIENLSGLSSDEMHLLSIAPVVLSGLRIFHFHISMCMCECVTLCYYISIGDVTFGPCAGIGTLVGYNEPTGWDWVDSRRNIQSSVMEEKDVMTSMV